MKKFLALIMALCMALTALSALAEEPAATDVSVSAEDLTGTWYLLMFGLTAGSVELKEDGTCTMSIAVDGEEEESPEMAWTLEGNVVSLAFEENAMNLTYDGTNLILSVEAIEALGGLDGSGLDASMLSSMVTFSREPGAITYNELMAYQNDGTVPEGKTKEEMDAAFASFFLSVLSIMSEMGSSGESGDTGDTGDPEPAPEAATATILDFNFFVRESWGGQEGVYMAKVQNETEVPVYINNGSLVITDAEGNTVGESTYFNHVGSRYLDPGEITFVSFTAKVSEGTPENYECVLETSPKGYYSKDLSVEVAKAELFLDLESDYNSGNYIKITIVNDGEEPLADIQISTAIKDAEGTLLDVYQDSLYSVELIAHSSVTLKTYLNSATVDYCKENSITPAQVEAYAVAAIQE